MKKILRSWMNLDEKKQEYLIVGGLVAILIATLIPMLIVARYTFRVGDDYGYGYCIGHAWEETHNFFLAMRDMIRYDIEEYNNWQGLYVSDLVYMMVLTFSGEKGYWITIYVTLIPMILAELFTGKVIFSDFLKISYRKVLLVLLPIIIFQIQLVPCASEGFYWMCGAVLYTTFYAVGVFAWGLIFKAAMKEKFSISLTIGMSIVMFLVGGSSYLSTLPLICLYVLAIAYAFWKKKPMRFVLCIEYLWLLACFILSVSCPGQKVRDQYEGNRMTPWGGIFRSFVEALKYIYTWSRLLVVILLLIAFVPILIRIIRETKIKYTLPGVFSFVSLGFYAAQFTPCVYAMSYIGPFRAQNIYRFTLFIFLTVNEWYWLGYLMRKNREKNWKFVSSIVSKTRGIIKHIPDKSVLWALLFVLVITSIMLSYGFTITFNAAYGTLRSGEIQQYYQEWQERYAILTDDSVEDVVLKPYTSMPYISGFIDMGDSMDFWINYAYAEYFGKNTVKVIAEPEE